MSGMAFRVALAARTELGPWPQAEEPRVYVCAPPMLSASGFSEFVIVTRDPRTGLVEIFAANEDGWIVDWEPLAEYPCADQKKALRAQGYEVVIFDAA